MNIPRVRFMWGFSLVANITITSRQRAGPRWDIVLKILIIMMRMIDISVSPTFLTIAVGSIFFLMRKSEVREKARLQPHIQA